MQRRTGAKDGDSNAFALARRPLADPTPTQRRPRPDRPLKTAYVTLDDPLDVASWSGINKHMALALEGQGVEMRYVGALRDRYLAVKKIRYRVGEALGLLRYLPDRSHLSARSYARQVQARLERSDCDVVFATGTIPLAFLRTELPVAFWSDATLPVMLDFYPSYSNVSRRSMRAGLELEQRALQQTSLAIYSSEWAAEAAIEHFQLERDRVMVVPFGANIDSAPTTEEIERIAEERSREHCQLLFLAVEWERKGGDIAVEAARWLNERAIPTTLVVAGCSPPADVSEPFVECRGFLDKKTRRGRAELHQLLAESHFLIHPARADATPIVLPEASAFGLPILASSVGGICTIVRSARNGYTLSPEADGEVYGALIKDMFEDRKRMLKLAHSSHREYRTRLNWDAAGAAVVQRLEQLVPERDRS
jgi:glycosyltransferase involved in cell wall biosynthesis